MRRLKAHAQETPLLCVGPTGLLSRARADRTHLRHLYNLTPRAANHSPRPIPEALPMPDMPVGRLAAVRQKNIHPAAPIRGIRMWDDRTTRRPRLLLRLSGALSLRYDARALTWALFQEPPRTTRRAV